MRHWAEGLLAVVILLALGGVLFLYSGEPLPSAGNGDGAGAITFDPEAAARGQVLAEGAGCLQCHTVDGSSAAGPTWKGLAGSDRPLTNGEFVRADDSYLFNSIIDPSSQIVSGFDDIMPASLGATLTEEELEDLVEFIKSLA